VPELETRLRELAADAVWPPTPDLEAAVMGRLRVRRPPRRPRRLVALVVAALVLVPAAGAVAFPGARVEVLEWLGLRHVSVQRVPGPPPPGARFAREDDLGVQVTHAEASARAGFAPLRPAGLGPPDRIRVIGQRVSLIYARRHLILTEVRGSLPAVYLRKLVYGATDVGRLRVNGRPGAFISGGPHGYLYETPGGRVQEERPLLAGPTLIWEQHGRVLRLEGRLDRAEALRVARTVR